jgi:hypothetical protein
MKSDPGGLTLLLKPIQDDDPAAGMRWQTLQLLTGPATEL